MAPEIGRLHYRVDGVVFSALDRASAFAVACSVESQEVVTIEKSVSGKVVERIDVTAALSVDPVDK